MITLKEYSGITDDNRDTDIFFLLLKNNARDYVQNNYGASPLVNAFQAIVRWVSSMES